MRLLSDSGQIDGREDWLQTSRSSQEPVGRIHPKTADRLWIISLLLVSNCVYSSHNTCVAEDVNPEIVARLRSDGVPAWQRLREFSERTFYTGSATQTSLYLDGEKNQQQFNDTYTCRVRRHFSARCGLIETSRPDGRRSVVAINPDYAFELRQDKKHPAWILDKAGTPPESPGISERGSKWDHHAWMIDHQVIIDLGCDQAGYFQN